MAKTVEKFPHVARGRKRTPLTEEWFNGKVWVLEKDTDFSSAVKSFAMRYRQEAKLRGLDAKVSVPNMEEPGTVYVQAFPQPKEKTSPQVKWTSPHVK